MTWDERMVRKGISKNADKYKQMFSILKEQC